MNQPEREMAEKLISAIEDNTRAHRELTKLHTKVFDYLSMVLPVFFLIAVVIYSMFQH